VKGQEKAFIMMAPGAITRVIKKNRNAGVAGISLTYISFPVIQPGPVL
jgi:hypothetical protein